MATIGQLATLLQTIPGITVFNDGKMYDGCMRDRTFNKTPFIQLIEDVTDTSEHHGGGQHAAYSIRGRYTHKRERNNNVRARNDLIAIMKGNNLFRLRIEESRERSAELEEIDFLVECWGTLQG